MEKKIFRGLEIYIQKNTPITLPHPSGQHAQEEERTYS